MTDNTINNDMTMGGATGMLLAGRYRVVRQLGQGGMGTVWLAEDTKLDGFKVAIKMLPSVLVNNKRAYAQVKAEALVSLKLSHPNIATVRAFEEENGNPFLVMDYIDGQTLDDYLAERCVATTSSSSHPAGLPEDEVIRILKPVAAALDYAHAQGVVHRDVKPGNIMIRKDGTPFVLDFGIAREIQETMTRVTGKLSSGTLLYMSPEQLHGAAPKPSQDIYSFAAMAYECLKAAPPFSRGQIEYQIEHDTPEPLPGNIAMCPSVMAGLEKDPESRPMTCTAVLGVGDGVAETAHLKKGERQNGRCLKIGRKPRSRFKLCKPFGISIYVDNSVMILLLLIFLLGFTELKEFVTYIELMLGLMIAVMWYEFGYAFIARMLGFQVNDIILSLYSGCASIDSLPLKPCQKILTALAWLLANFAIAFVMFFWWVIQNISLFDENPAVKYEAIGGAIIMSGMLFGLNLLPGLPMDGGYIIRRVLLRFVSRPKATFVAMCVGRAFAILLVICGVGFVFPGHCQDWRLSLVAILVACMIWKDGNYDCRESENE